MGAKAITSNLEKSVQALHQRLKPFDSEPGRELRGASHAQPLKSFDVKLAALIKTMGISAA